MSTVRPDKSAVAALPGTPRPAGVGEVEALLRRILYFCGVDRAIAYTLVGRGWSVLSGPITLFLIARFLRPEEQGIYYTFGSVIGMNIFFELGLTYVLLQFASHEKAHLDWTAEGTLAGAETARMRLGALLRMALKWFSVAATLVVLVVLPAGLLFFSRISALPANIAWRVPWMWLVGASALNLLMLPFLGIIEGCGMVAQIASFRFLQAVAANIGLWLALALHSRLFAGPLFQTINVAVAAIWISSRFRHFALDLLHLPIKGKPLNWLVEVWPFQWRIALSFLSVYFIPMLFTPAMYAALGPVAAGQMGMSITLCGGIYSVPVSWMNTKSSPFGVLTAKKNWAGLDTLFFSTFRRALFLLVTGSIVVLVCVVELGHISQTYAMRFLDTGSIGMLLAANLANLVTACLAMYLRAHKAEPYLWLMMTGAAMTAAFTFSLARPFGAAGISAGYLFTSVVSSLVATAIFIRRRREWHSAG